jgi:hypothetical protein
MLGRDVSLPDQELPQAGKRGDVVLGEPRDDVETLAHVFGRGKPLFHDHLREERL